MPSNIEITKETYVWTHFAVILVHLAIGGTLIYIYFSKFEARSIREICLIIGCVLVIISLLAMVPIFIDYKDVRDLIINKE